MESPHDLLKACKTVLLVDWVRQEIPRSLLNAGLVVFGSSPGGYSRAELTQSEPDEAGARTFAPETSGQTGYLAFRRLPGPPREVDVVAVYRPAAEIPEIIAKQVRPLRAKAVWSPSQSLSSEARRELQDLGITVVEGVDIGEVAGSLGEPFAR